MFHTNGGFLGGLAVEAVTYFADGGHIPVFGSSDALFSNGEQFTSPLGIFAVDDETQGFGPRLFAGSPAWMSGLSFNKRHSHEFSSCCDCYNYPTWPCSVAWLRLWFNFGGYLLEFVYFLVRVEAPAGLDDDVGDVVEAFAVDDVLHVFGEEVAVVHWGHIRRTMMMMARRWIIFPAWRHDILGWRRRFCGLLYLQH